MSDSHKLNRKRYKRPQQFKAATLRKKHAARRERSKERPPLVTEDLL